MAKKQWGDYQPLKRCKECGRLAKPWIYDFVEDNCPDCGSTDIETVIAQWEMSVNFGGVVTFYRNQIKPSEKKQSIESIKKERDELLAALKLIEKMDGTGAWWKYQEIARATIAKVEDAK